MQLINHIIMIVMHAIAIILKIAQPYSQLTQFVILAIYLFIDFSIYGHCAKEVKLLSKSISPPALVPIRVSCSTRIPWKSGQYASFIIIPSTVLSSGSSVSVTSVGQELGGFSPFCSGYPSCLVCYEPHMWIPSIKHM